MSLINDALKRAKESQQQNPPPPPQDLPLLLATQSQRSGTPSWLWPVIIVLLVGFGAFLIGQSINKHKAGSVESTAATTPPAATTPTESHPMPAPAPQTKAVVAETQKSSQPTAAPVENPSPKPEIIATPVATQPTPAEVVAPVATKLPPLKLQSIIYDPQRPSVMINGRLLFVGDLLGELRVAEIRRNSATLVGAGVTNVLSLPEY